MSLMKINISWWCRKMFILLVMICLGRGVKAQTLEEWTKQKKLQTSYKLNQIAALSAYLDVAKKGYEIARLGWEMIGDIQNGEFSLHTDYFGALLVVHPLVRDYPKVAEIMKLYWQIRKKVNWINGDISGFRMLGSDEIKSMANFNNNVVLKADQTLFALEQVLASHAYEMGDAERLAVIDSLYLDMQELFTATKSYHNRIGSLELNRKRKEIQQQQMNRFYDVR